MRTEHSFRGHLLVRTWLLGVAAIVLSACESDTSQTSKTATTEPAKVTVQVPQPEITLGAGQRTELKVNVRVPPDHHGYLDAGDDGLLIPIGFAYQEVTALGIGLTPATGPSGERDEKFKARVLRGDGQFVFSVDGSQASLTKTTTAKVSVRSQICNDKTEVCYPPVTDDVTVTFVPTAN